MYLFVNNFFSMGGVERGRKRETEGGERGRRRGARRER